MEHWDLRGIKMVEELDLKGFKKNIIVKGKTCLVKFYSNTCPLCLGLAPIYENISEQYDNVNFYKVDVNKEEDLTKRLDFDGVPTLFLFHEGKYSEVPFPYDNPDDLTGYRKSDIIDHINKKVK